MAKTVGFLAGLALGAAAAYGAFKALSPEKQEKLVKGAQDKIGGLRDTALDYAYYATDKLEDARDHVNTHREGSARPVDLVAKSYELADKAKEKAQEVIDGVKEKLSNDSEEKESENDDISVDLTEGESTELPSTGDVKAAFDDAKAEVLQPSTKKDAE